MLKKILFAIVAMLLSTSVFANGYWETREVCDYETITSTNPYTLCEYGGNLYSNGSSIYSYATDTKWGHVSCPGTYYQTESRSIYNSQTQQWENQWFSGHLYLYLTQHLTSTSTTQQVIEGSCRTERVWIPLCDGCQIP